MRSDRKFRVRLARVAGHLIAGLGRKDRQELQMLKKPIRLSPGTFLVKAGERPDKIFVHRCGVIRMISSRATGGGVGSKDDKADQVFGLAEMLTDSEFDHSIKSVSGSEFFSIDKRDLIEFLARRPQLISRFSTELSGLYRDAVRQIREQ